MTDKKYSSAHLLPVSIDEACALLKEGFYPVAGGTDLMVRNHAFSKLGKAVKAPLFSCRKIPETRVLEISEGKLVIGSSITISELIDFPQCPEVLRQSLLSIASPGIRNIASLAGNICNASPAADSLPALYVLNAVIKTAGIDGSRQIPISDFITGPGKTSLLENEIVLSAAFPLDSFSYYFRKIGTRAANALSKLSIAAVYKKDGNTFSEFRLAIGACGPKVIRCAEAEKIITSGKNDSLDKLMISILAIYENEINAINDQRSTAVYRRNTAVKLIKYILSQGDDS